MCCLRISQPLFLLNDISTPTHRSSSSSSSVRADSFCRFINNIFVTCNIIYTYIYYMNVKHSLRPEWRMYVYNTLVHAALIHQASIVNWYYCKKKKNERAPAVRSKKDFVETRLWRLCVVLCTMIMIRSR